MTERESIAPGDGLSTAARTLAASFALVLLAACGGSKTEWRTYTEVAVEPAAPAMSDMMASAAGSPALEWSTPEGWNETKGSGMRLASFSLGEGSSTGLCTIILLGGDAGGLEANVARWIKQTGVEVPEGDAMQAFIAKQQKLKSDGGFEVFLADLTPLAPNDEASSMLASIVTVGESSCFVKLTGSAGFVKAQKEKFSALNKSLKKGGAPHVHTPAAQQPAGGAESSSSLKWKAPEGWTESAGSGMRLATFAIGSGNAAGMCTIIMLGGAAGGAEANVARWIGQLKLKPLSEEEMKAFLARQQVVKAAGGFDILIADLTALTADDTADSMLGSIATIDGQTCFVKLTGPAALLNAQKENFIQLCKSLTQ